MEVLRIAILISGNGTTLQNLLDRIAAGGLAAKIVLVISSKADAYGLTRAESAGIPTAVVARKDFTTSAYFSDAIFEHCRRAKADLVCMAGFLQLVTIPDDFVHRVMNVHPALIPAFCGHGYYGSRVHKSVLKSGVKITGCTIHFADNEYDRGPIILQRAVPVLDDDNADTLAARVFEKECEAYPEAIQLYAEKRLRVDGQIVHVRCSEDVRGKGPVSQ